MSAREVEISTTNRKEWRRWLDDYDHARRFPFVVDGVTVDAQIVAVEWVTSPWLRRFRRGTASVKVPA